MLAALLCAVGVAVAAAAVGARGDGAAPDDPPEPFTGARSDCTRAVSTSGSDSRSGRPGNPWRTLDHAFSSLRPGDVLCVGAGAYVAPRVTVPAGTAERRVVVQPAGRARPEVRGPALVKDPDHWVLRGLLWRNPGGDEPVVTLLGGTGWAFEGNVVTDGSYAGLLVARSEDEGSPQDYAIRDNVVHDTGASNLYHNPGRQSRGGLIERNLLFGSSSQNLKLGWGGTDACSGSNYEQFGIGEVTVRHNTLHDAPQPLAIAEPGGDAPVLVERNLVTGPRRSAPVRIAGVEGCLGDDVRIVDNLGDGGERFVEDFGDAPTIVARARDNVHPHDPRYDSTDGPAGFHPQDELAQQYGRYAP